MHSSSIVNSLKLTEFAEFVDGVLAERQEMHINKYATEGEGSQGDSRYFQKLEALLR